MPKSFLLLRKHYSQDEHRKLHHNSTDAADCKVDASPSVYTPKENSPLQWPFKTPTGIQHMYWQQSCLFQHPTSCDNKVESAINTMHLPDMNPTVPNHLPLEVVPTRKGIFDPGKQQPSPSFEFLTGGVEREGLPETNILIKDEFQSENPRHDEPKHWNTCKHCDKKYTSLGALKMHIRTHTLPCKCKICGKCFSRQWLLQGHTRTHTGEKPFSCSLCRRAFADRSNLRAHLQTHAETKKYSCLHCRKSFSRMSLLVKHDEAKCLLFTKS